MTDLRFDDGVLFFPVTPFTLDDTPDLDLFSDHVAGRLVHRPGAVFAACGTGEFHALSTDEVASVVRAAVDTVGGRVPVVAGTGGALGAAVASARAAAEAGADGLLLLPPYLVSGTVDGLVAWVTTIMRATELPVIVYHRGTARFKPEALIRLARDERLVGFKDGTGDIGLAQEIALAASTVGRQLALFNGLLTAELSQAAYRAIGIPLYSSAAFGMVPEVANLYFDAYVSGDEERRHLLLRRFYQPLVALRDETPGFGVSLVKAGLRLRGTDVGSVRPPLVDPTPRQLEKLRVILDEGLELAADLGYAAGQRAAR